MRRLMVFLVTAALAVLMFGCDVGGEEEGTGSLFSALKANHKVMVCHPTGLADKAPLLLLVDEHAASAHLDHGDWLVIEEEICGDGLDNDCDWLVDEDCNCLGGKCCPEGENCTGQEEQP